MRHPYFNLLFILIWFIHAAPAIGQNLDLKYVEFKDDKLVVHYSLSDSLTGRFYVVRLYSSKDNFLNPLEEVTNDVGLEVRPGPDNTIVWDAKSELGSIFDGKVSLEIRARFFIPFINVESINQYRLYKRNRKYNLTWTGGTPQNILNFDLYKGTEKILSFPNLANVGSYVLEFPSHIKPSGDYRFRISDSKNREDVVYTSRFKVKRKIPLLLKAIPVFIIGAGLVVLLQPKPTDPDLPGAPLPAK